MSSEILVREIEFEFPSRGTSSFSAMSRKKPRARVRFELDDGQFRDRWVPVRVARLFNKSLPEEGSSLQEAMSTLSKLEEQQCFAVLTEMLSRRDHSVHEAREKLLLSGFKPGSIDLAIAKAENLRYLDDARFTEAFIEERVRRGWGRRKVELELSRRGVDPFLVEGWPERFFSHDSDLERALAALSKKSIPTQNGYQKFVRHLMGKGFSYDVASEAAKRRMSDAADGLSGIL